MKLNTKLRFMRINVVKFNQILSNKFFENVYGIFLTLLGYVLASKFIF